MRKLAHASIVLTLLTGCATHASVPQPQATTASPQVIQPTLKTVKQASSTASRTLSEPSQQPQFKNEARKSTGETVSSASSEPSSRNDGQAADTEAVLIASDPDSQINLRATPEVSGKYLGYGLIGDRVQVIQQTTADGYTWHKVRFPLSGAIGWIRGDFVRVADTLKTNQPSSKPPIYSSSSSEVTSNAPTYYTPAVATSGGSCNSPDDLDSRGHRCGARASGVRSGGRRRR